MFRDKLRNIFRPLKTASFGTYLSRTGPLKTIENILLLWSKIDAKSNFPWFQNTRCDSSNWWILTQNVQKESFINWETNFVQKYFIWCDCMPSNISLLHLYGHGHDFDFELWFRVSEILPSQNYLIFKNPFQSFVFCLSLKIGNLQKCLLIGTVWWPKNVIKSILKYHGILYEFSVIPKIEKDCFLNQIKVRWNFNLLKSVVFPFNFFSLCQVCFMGPWSVFFRLGLC